MKYFIQILKTDVGGDARRHHHHRHARADGATYGAQRAPMLTLMLGCKPNRRLSPPPPPGSSFCPAQPILLAHSHALRLPFYKFLLAHLPRTHAQTLAACRSDSEGKGQVKS